MADRYEDERGVIQDIIGRIDSVTRITTVKGAVRGNHIHRETTQWTLILKGRLLMATDADLMEMGPLEVIKHDPGQAHAWKAIEDTECLVLTKGPRAGTDYESDTYRLDDPLIA